eukprot:Nitzschia sp. Nitz4//scaffold18_size181773//8608//10629//NITZ4_001890-RA/size181773-snap-gene-0.254-mRNA-1//1//CDS//3329539936//8940//frame0
MVATNSGEDFSKTEFRDGASPALSSGDESEMDESVKSFASSVSGAHSTTSELEERFQRALMLDSELSFRMIGEEEVNDITQEELDALYARDMFELTPRQRERVLQEVHGISDDQEQETPEFVDKHRKLLDKELERISSHRSPGAAAYLKAIELNRSYIHSEGFQLQFLRSQRWNARQAASRLVDFLDMKRRLFGEGCLARPVAISDLSRDDRKSLDSGFFQVVPTRDVAGRTVMCGIPMLRKYKDPENLKRTVYYMMMTALEDTQTQKRGIVLVGYNVGPNRVVDRKAVFAVLSVCRHLPMRIASIHYCYDDMKFRPMMTIAMLIMGATNRVRLRGHFGSPDEVRYKMQAFGVPVKALPLTSVGDPKVKGHKSWVKLRDTQEMAGHVGDTSLYVVVPVSSDVLLGRGKPFQEHFGNLRYHALLDQYQNLYERVKKFDKMKITQRIIEIVRESQGRFLVQEGAGWVAVNDEVGRAKIAHGFRTRRVSTAANSPSPGLEAESLDFDLVDTPPTPTSRNQAKRKDANAMTTILENEDSSGAIGTQTTKEATDSSPTLIETDQSDEMLPDSNGLEINGCPKRVKLWAAEFHEIET